MKNATSLHNPCLLESCPLLIFNLNTCSISSSISSSISRSITLIEMWKKVPWKSSSGFNYCQHLFKTVSMPLFTDIEYTMKRRKAAFPFSPTIHQCYWKSFLLRSHRYVTWKFDVAIYVFGLIKNVFSRLKKRTRKACYTLQIR